MARLASQSDWGINAEWLLNGLKSRDVTMEQMVKAVGDHFTVGVDCCLPLDDYLSLLNWGVDHLNNSKLGLELAANLTASDFGIYGYLVGHSPTVAELLNNAIHYQSIIMRGMGFELNHVGDVVDLQWHIFRPDSEGTRQDTEFTLASVLTLLRRGLKESLDPEYVHFTHKIAGDPEKYERAFNCEVLFEQPTNSLVLRRQYLSYPLGETDPKLLNVLKQQADTLLEQWRDSSDLIPRVKFLIAASFGEKGSGVESVSRRLNVSSRTLNRWLTTAGTNYNCLREEVLLEAAKNALCNSTSSITDVGARLGYSESSAFVRAFKRLSGDTPASYRKKMQLARAR